jgi:hypothetical protein
MFKIVGEEGFSKWMSCEENTQYKSIWKAPFLEIWLLHNLKPETHQRVSSRCHENNVNMSIREFLIDISREDKQ